MRFSKIGMHKEMGYLMRMEAFFGYYQIISSKRKSSLHITSGRTVQIDIIYLVFWAFESHSGADHFKVSVVFPEIFI
jgi:hypothetical protein